MFQKRKEDVIGFEKSYVKKKKKIYDLNCEISVNSEVMEEAREFNYQVMVLCKDGKEGESMGKKQCRDGRQLEKWEAIQGINLESWMGESEQWTWNRAEEPELEL